MNEDIRALARAAWGRPFTDDERARYQLLRDEWVEAVRTCQVDRTDVTTAA
ncbi:hypothetical protein [Streptomyces flaveolus]|uniref:hypothetical protein n=1 Tax=Streptomyces flaveolus TaxID=67297 RepID=UPI0033F72B34